MYDLYLAQYTHKYGNGYAIIGARNAEQVSSILKNQGRFKDAIIVACKKIELPTPPDGDMQLMIEGAVTTIGNSAYDIAVSLGYRGTKEEWLESMKGPKGDPGPTGSYIAGKGIDITDGVISVIESGGSKVSYTPNITEGTKLGTLNIDDRDYNIYSPTPVDAYTKDETDDLLDTKQDTLTAGANITIEGNTISATVDEEAVWEKDTNNNIFPKGNTNVTGTSCFVTGLTSKADHTNNISIGYNNESKSDNTIVIGTNVKDFDSSGDAIGWANLIAIGNNPIIPPRLLNTSYSTEQQPKFIIGGLYADQRYNTLEQTVNGDLYIKGINGWTGVNATPDGTSHLQGYLSGLDTRISNNTTAISGKQDTISAGNGIDVTNNVVSVDNTIAKKTDVYTKNETDFLLGGKQNTLTAGENISIENNVISVPRDVTLENIQSPSDNTAINIGSNSGQTRDNIYLTAWGYNSDAQISMEGSGNDNESASIYINAYGYSDANMQLRGGGETRKSQVDITASGWADSAIELKGGTQSDEKATMMFTANGSTETAEIQMRGGDANNASYVNINSEKFTYKDKNISVDPTTQSFSNNSSLTLVDNTIYTASEAITTLTITGATGTSVVSFDTATSGTITVTLPQSIIFADTPTFNNNEHWEIAIRNGYAVYTKYDLV